MEITEPSDWRLRQATLAALVVVVGASFALKYYRGPGDWFVNDYGPASVGYEMFFMLLAFLAWPRRTAITPIAVGVCLLTCGLEFLQAVPWPAVDRLRATWLGLALLGNTFSWWDLPAYPIGCLAGWLLLRFLERRYA